MSNPDPTEALFEELAARGREPLLANGRGKIRIDLKRGGKTVRWLVTIDRGAVEVSRRNARADCVVRADKTLFDGIARGEVNALAAILRGVLSVEGDLQLFAFFQRVFPGPSREKATA